MASLALRKGTKARYGGGDVTIVALDAFNSATVLTSEGEYFTASVSDLLKGDDAPQKPVKADPIRQGKVAAYLAAFKPLLGKRATRAQVAAAGAKVGIGRSAAYAALARYDLSNKAADLPPPTRNGGRNRSRLDPRIEKIIEDGLARKILRKGAHDVDGFIEHVTLAVEKLGLKVGVSTLRNRVDAVEPYKVKSRQLGYDEAEKTLDAHIGEHPGAARPLDQVQCDHWTTDVEILNDERLVVIGRAWATLAIDIHSRAVWGMYVGLSAPSTTSVGMAMINGFLHKEQMLQDLGIDTSMPIYGKPGELLLDNAGEFTGKSIQASADHFNIDLTWRPVRKPQYGAHIERLNATLASAFKSLPGATGPDVAQRKAFKAGPSAALTLDDLRKQMWMMVDEYHNTPHLGIGGATPLEKWTAHFFGPKGARRPLPTAWADDDDLRLHWYPLEYRSIQRYGIVIDYLRYYNESIQFLVRNRARYKTVAVRRHPLDVRLISFLHPERQEWCELPCRLFGMPAASLVDWSKAKKEALKKTRAPRAEHLRDIIVKRLEHQEEAKKATRTAAREETRRADEARRRKAMSKPAKAAPATKTGAAADPKGPAAEHPPAAANRFASILKGVRDEDIEGMIDE